MVEQSIIERVAREIAPCLDWDVIPKQGSSLEIYRINALARAARVWAVMRDAR